MKLKSSNYRFEQRSYAFTEQYVKMLLQKKEKESIYRIYVLKNMKFHNLILIQILSTSKNWDNDFHDHFGKRQSECKLPRTEHLY